LRNDDQREQPQHRVGPVRVTRDFSPSAKHRLVQDSTSLDETAFGAFLRKEGVRCTDLTTWRAQAAEGALGVLTGKRQRTVAQKRPCQLEAELRRKDRPLPETALFVLS
jgi:transposase-like protein